MNIESNLKDSLTQIRVVNDNRAYWFVRTYGGEVFEDFIINNHIGLGFNNVPQQYIVECENFENNEAQNRLYDFLKNNTNYEGGSITKWKNQLIRFQHEMKNGDIVVIPNKDSNILSIGEITSSVKPLESNKKFYFKDEIHDYPNRVREVKWIKHRPKHFFQNDLRNLFSTRQAITNANDYANKIESGISNMFIRENKMRLVISINQNEDINAFALRDFLDSLTYFYKEFCQELGIEDNEELYIKIKLQSKGKTVLIGSAAAAIVGVSLILSLSKDASFKGKILNQEYEFSSGEGLISTYSNYLNEEQERKIQMIKFLKSQEDLNVLEPTSEQDSLTKEQFISGHKLEQNIND